MLTVLFYKNNILNKSRRSAARNELPLSFGFMNPIMYTMRITTKSPIGM